jgi:hypothetical protein
MMPVKPGWKTDSVWWKKSGSDYPGRVGVAVAKKSPAEAGPGAALAAYSDWMPVITQGVLSLVQSRSRCQTSTKFSSTPSATSR